MRTMPPSGANATPRAAALWTRQAYESQFKIPMFHMLRNCSFVRVRDYALHGRDGYVSTLLAIPSEAGYALWCAEGLPTFTLEKLIPGGIAEVRPQQGRAGEGQGAPGFRLGSNPWADCDCLWVSRIIMVIIKQGLYPPKAYLLEVLLEVNS